MRPPSLALRISLLVISIFVVSCSLEREGKVERINPGAVRGGLNDTLPPTTSSTTTTAPLLPPPPTEPPPTSVVATEKVRLYYIASRQLTYRELDLESPVLLDDIIATLQIIPDGAGLLLRTAVPASVVITVNDDGGGVAQVNLPQEFFGAIEPTDQRFAVAQIVLTLRSRPGIGQVVFNQPVPRGDNSTADAGIALTLSDYEALLSPPTEPPPTEPPPPPPETAPVSQP
jgi:hypothetical protein